ncbi:hypothetical protein APSETT445_008050 [Aspergillus pseudonomiae]
MYPRVLGRWHWYVFVAQWILIDQNFLASSTPFSLYLKAKPDLYSVTRINTLPTIATAVSIVAALIAGTAADKKRNFWLPSIITTIPVLLGLVLLVVWDVGEAGRLAGFILTGAEGAMSPLTMSWATVTMANDAEERAIVTASMNAIGQAMSAWTQLLQYPAVEAPNFRGGGIGNLIRSALLDPANKDKELHFYSSSGGNAGLAAVIAARDLGCHCTVVVPHSTKPLMISKLRAAGATDVIQYGSSWFEADTYLRQTFIEKEADEKDADATEQRNIYVPPFDHPDVWKGAGTMVSEIATQLPPRDTPAGYAFPADAIVCSVGGGGLFNGIVEGLGDYMRSHPTPDLITGTTSKNVCVLAAETNGADSLALSLRSGSLQSLPAISSLATSLGALRVAPQTLKNAQSPPAGVDVVSIVGSDAEAAKGIIHLADELRLQVELACGISVEIAAGSRLREAVPDLTPDSRVVVVVCGGSNITAEMIAEYRQRLQNGWK